ncbi:hypothetical protein, partial [Sporofaciens musculi]|uniref:hypothetical protein n=1 Tax=Sporofaciens musculi TaxID=2681861 RepID=UPI002582D78F
CITASPFIIICNLSRSYHPACVRRSDVGDEVDLQKMFKELTGYEKNRVDLRIDGIPASPMQIVQAHVAREESAYMRDYVLNEKGDIKELWFTNIESN